MERQTPVHSDLVTTPRFHRRSGFTLVELLAVIMIIALLAGLLTPAVMRARNSARNAAIKAEIDMLHMAIMNYKNEYGSFPPCFSDVTSGTSPAAKHLQRLFPRCANGVAEFTAVNAVPITPSNAIVSWLGGYTSDPSLPLSGAGGRKKLFDFDQSRVLNGTYYPAGKKGSPYIYIPSSQYTLSGMPYDASDIASNSAGAHYMPPAPLPNPFPADPLTLFTNLSLPAPQTQGFANADTFQILCAGADERFGTDDDLSSFWTGTRKQYLDSLK